MNDGISTTANPPRCPVCDGATATAPGAVCPACGVKFAPRPVPIPDLRLTEEEGWLWGHESQLYNLIGGFALILVVFSVCFAPGLLIFLAALLVPAGMRTIRLATRPEAREAESFARYLYGALLASFGVAVVAGTAAAVSFGVICWAIAMTGSGFENVGIGLIVGGVVGLGLFVLIFAKLWPRESAYDKIRRPPDPEE